MYVVISYKENYTPDDISKKSGNSSFDMKGFSSLNECADYIGECLDDDPHAENQFLVFDRWDNLVSFSQNYSQQLDNYDDSIRCPCKNGDYEEMLRLDQKEVNLRTMVRDRLTSLDRQRKLKGETQDYFK